MRLVLITILLITSGCAMVPPDPPPRWQLYTYTRTVDPTKITVDTNISTGYPTTHNDGLGYNPYTRGYGYTAR